MQISKRILLILFHFYLISINVNAQVFEWAASISGLSTQEIEKVTTDQQGNVHVIGTMAGLTDLDPGPDTYYIDGGIYQSIFVSKLDPNGTFLWAKHFKHYGGSNDDYPTDIAVDDSGNVYLTGMFSDSVDFDPGVNSSFLVAEFWLDAFVCKLNTAGNFVWAKQLKSTSSVFSNAITVGTNGRIYVVGDHSGKTDFDPGPDTNYRMNGGFFLCTLNAMGDLVSLNSPNSTDSEITCLTTDAAGSVYVAGQYHGKIDFDPTQDSLFLTSTAIPGEVFIAKMNAFGKPDWVVSLPDVRIVNAIEVDHKGNIITTGTFGGTADFNPGPGTNNLTALVGSDVYILKLANTGNYKWAKRIAGTGAEEALDIAIDSADNIYTIGIFNGQTDFDPSPNAALLTSAGSYDAFTCSFDEQGEFNWVTHISNSSAIYARGINVDIFGNIYSVGSFVMSADFDPGTGNFFISSLGNSDAFIQKLRLSSFGNAEPRTMNGAICYPNPTTGSLTIEFSELKKLVLVRLLTISGTMLMQQESQNTRRINLELAQPNGVYLLEVQDQEGNQATYRVLKK